ncbi:agmatine/peptidylarginine deiminase [Acidobacteriota bacterium]
MAKQKNFKITKSLIAFIVFLGLIGCLSCSQPNITEDTFLYPAEFEEHESIWLAWPTYEYEPDYSNEDVVLKIIESLAPYVLVDLMVRDEAELEKVKNIFETTNLPHDHVRFRLIPRGDIWIRDMGPIFLKNGKGEMKIADLGFNSWGYDRQTSEYSMVAERVDRLVARTLKLPVIRSSMIGEGGNREFNGKGIMMVTEVVELQRNPDWTKAELEKEYKRIFNVKKVIWLPEGVAEDDFTFKGVLPGRIFVRGTGGHIDEYARFVGPNTILLAEVTPEERDTDPIAKITYERMGRNFNILKNATDLDGKPFEIIRVPYTKAIYETLDDYNHIQYLKNISFEDGTVIEDDESITLILATSYLNFIVTNGVVLIPAYWKEGRSEEFKQKDEAFKQIIEKVFPNRDIIQINPEAINIGGGGMHCISQQMPATN